MTMFDVAVIVVLVFSIFLGRWRGVIYEVMSLLSWVAAYFVALLFAPDLMPYVPPTDGTDTVKMGVAFAILFVATLGIGSILAWFMNRLVKSAGLTKLDGSLGATFGFVRGCFLVLVLVLVGGMTTMPASPFWKDALTSSPLEEVAVAVRDGLPDALAKKIHYRD